MTDVLWLVKSALHRGQVRFAVGVDDKRTRYFLCLPEANATGMHPKLGSVESPLNGGDCSYLD